MFKILKTEGKARRGEFSCAHGGTVQTPVFMNVGTQAAIKGGVSALDLKNVGCQIELSNTYHLHLRPGDKVVRQMGGLHKFMNWDGPILTDSGGFQVFSLASLRKIKEEGVTFASHIDGHRIFMGPEYITDDRPISESCNCPVCRSHSRAYLRHLFKADEVLALRLAVLHNLWFYNELMAKIREALDNGAFADFREKYSGNLEKRA